MCPALPAHRAHTYQSYVINLNNICHILNLLSAGKRSVPVVRQHMTIAMWIVLFLDIDGVLNTRKSLLEDREMDKDCLEQLERVVKATGCKIVISSSWRIMGKMHVIRMMNKTLGRVGETVRAVIGCTPTRLDNSDLRGDEIQAWLDKHTDQVQKFIILDDETDMGALLPHLVQTNIESGLTPEIADELIEKLRA